VSQDCQHSKEKERGGERERKHLDDKVVDRQFVCRHTVLGFLRFAVEHLTKLQQFVDADVHREIIVRHRRLGLKQPLGNNLETEGDNDGGGGRGGGRKERERTTKEEERGAWAQQQQGKEQWSCRDVFASYNLKSNGHAVMPSCVG
jgi:hypothetical protein